MNRLDLTLFLYDNIINITENQTKPYVDMNFSHNVSASLTLPVSFNIMNMMGRPIHVRMHFRMFSGRNSF